jgi:hypothetical protein
MARLTIAKGDSIQVPVTGWSLWSRFWGSCCPSRQSLGEIVTKDGIPQSPVLARMRQFQKKGRIRQTTARLYQFRSYCRQLLIFHFPEHSYLHHDLVRDHYRRMSYLRCHPPFCHCFTYVRKSMPGLRFAQIYCLILKRQRRGTFFGCFPCTFFLCFSTACDQDADNVNLCPGSRRMDFWIVGVGASEVRA